MSILASRGLSVPTFQPAAGKEDGTGNGAGGMFFGQGQQDENQQFYFDPFREEVDTDDMVYSLPIMGDNNSRLAVLKAGLAEKLYREINKIDFLRLGLANPN